MLVYNQILNEIVEVLLQLEWVREVCMRKIKSQKSRKQAFMIFFQLQFNN